jgi:hypothetical protein
VATEAKGVSLNRFAKRRDANEEQIVSALLAEGFDVFKLDKPLDLLVWRKNGVAFAVLEVKTDVGRTTSDQDDFLRRTTGCPRAVVRTAEEALAAARQWC